MTSVEYIYKVVPDAFHGTSKSNAENILRTKKFILSRSEDCYLGDGIYFFEGAQSLAEWWAKKQNPDKQVGIILASIQLGRCLDLANPDHRNLVKGVGERIKRRKDKEEISDALILNLITTKIEPEIETIRGIFPGGKGKIYYGSRIYDRIHIMICVKKATNILKFKITYGG